jgi:Predicted nucleotide-binding protein containing TIR-like domain
MDKRLMVSVQNARRENLTRQQCQFLDALTNRIKHSGLDLLLLSDLSDNKERFERISQCHGAVVVAFRQIKGHEIIRAPKKPIILPTEFTHIYAALATIADQPLLLLREKSVARRGALRQGYVHFIDFPDSPDQDWLTGYEFEREYQAWLDSVKQQKHVFLGYSKQFANTGHMLRDFIVKKLGLSVLNWEELPATKSILEAIERAEKLTRYGIFLFMPDDETVSGGNKHWTARDNVIFEAGYFAGAKGRSRSLIILEGGVEVPTDLKGIICLQLESRTEVGGLQDGLKRELMGIFGKG